MITATGNSDMDLTNRMREPRRENSVVSPDPTKVIQSIESDPYWLKVVATSASMALTLKNAFLFRARGRVRPSWQ